MLLYYLAVSLEYWKRLEAIFCQNEKISSRQNEFRNSIFLMIRFDHFNPKGGVGGGSKVPAGQEIVCHFSQGYAMVTKILDFIHKRSN